MILRTAFFLALSSAMPTYATSLFAYMNTTAQQFGVENLTTGVFSPLGNTTLNGSNIQLAGLGEVGGNLYGASQGSLTLYQINPANGALTDIGNNTTGFNYVAFGSTLTNLYALDFSFNLYSVNPATGATTLLGATGLSPGGNYELSTNSNTLYFTAFADAAHNNFTENLYTLNTTNGQANLVGPTGGPQMGALIVEGTTLYGGQTSPSSNVDTLSTSSGTATQGAALSGTSGAGSTFDGLAADPIPGPATPEPGTWSLLLGGIGVLVGIKRRKKSQNPR